MPRPSHQPLTQEQRLARRNQALAGLRDLQRALERSLGARSASPRYLTPIHNRDRLNRALDLLKQAEEDVPPWLYHRGPIYPGALRSTRTERPLDAVSLASVLGKTMEARELFDMEIEGGMSA